MSSVLRTMTKSFRAADGTFRTLTSYDGGATWQMSKAKARRRYVAASNLHGHRYTQKIEIRCEGDKRIAKKHKTRLGGGPVILPVTEIGSPILGKAKGKNAKYRRNLRKRVPAKVIAKRASRKGFAGIGIVPVSIHKHRCHGQLFVCACEQPWLKHKCGGEICLMEG